MQIDQPHHAPPHTIGEFLRQYAMIVLSILTALGLEHSAVDIQQRQAAQASRVRIEAELARNLADLRTSEQINLANAAKVHTLLRALIALIKAGKPIDADTEALMKPAFANFVIAGASWQRSAWDAAIADQSAGHLTASMLSHYSQIYATAADEISTWQILLGGEWLTQASDLLLESQIGKLDIEATAKVLVRFLIASEQIEKGEESLAALMTGGPAPAPLTPGR